jgi:putative transposase
MDYRYGSHTIFKIEYHFVFVTKYRYHVLVGDVGFKVRDLIKQTCDFHEIEIKKGAVSKDHVHILVSAPPSMAPSEIMRRVKGRSARKLFEYFPELRKRYWGKHLWARGYFCVTSGEVTQKMIENYIEHHFEPKIGENFGVEE